MLKGCRVAAITGDQILHDGQNSKSKEMIFRIKWSAKSTRKGSKERTLLETSLPHPSNHHILPMAGNFDLGEVVICEVDGVRVPIPTGVSVSPGSLDLRENGQAAELVVSLHSPLACDNCSINIQLTSRNNCESLIFIFNFLVMTNVMFFFQLWVSDLQT